MAWAGAYSLDVYCDGDRESGAAVIGHADSCERFKFAGPAQYSGETRADCVKQARERGWLFTRDGRTLCRACVKKRRRKT